MAKVIIPTGPTELEEMLSDDAVLSNLHKEGQLPEFLRAYVDATARKTPDIAAQVREETQRTLTAWLKENELPAVKRLDISNTIGAPGDARSPYTARHGLYNKAALGARVDNVFASWAECLHAVWQAANSGQMLDNDVREKLSKLRNAFGSTVPADGGFLIPEVLRSELLRVSLETAVMRPRARVIPMDSLRVPFPVIDSTTNAGSVYGGVTAYWTEEAAALVESSATFGRVVLDAKKLTAYAEVPSELLTDSIVSFQAFLDQIFPEALGFFEDIAFMSGSGVGEPFGALNVANPAMITVAAEAAQTSGTVVWQNIVKMFARMLPSSLMRGIWVASPDVFPELATMALNVGTGGSAVWLGNGQGTPPVTILGRPVVFSEKTPAALGTQGDLSFIDPSYYLIGDRQAMSAMTSPHYKFGNDKVAYRVIQRLDGTPWLLNPITPANSSATLSAFVQLTTR